MGLDLTYDADGATFTQKFSQSEWAEIEALRAHLPDEIGVCFYVQELGESVRIKTIALKESAVAIDQFLAKNAQLLPATYEYKLGHIMDGTPMRFFNGGGFSGLRLPGDPDHWYSIRTGLNECTLTKMKKGPDGKGVLVEKRDLRGETELLTENFGKVQFRRRAAKTTLRLALREIAAFAERIDSAELTKTVG
jgi:hypothetical protein